MLQIKGFSVVTKKTLKRVVAHPQNCTGKYLNPDPNWETTCKEPDLQTFCGNNGCREMFKLAVSKKNQNAVLTSAQKILLIVCRKFQNFSKKKEKRMHIIINNKYVLGN